MNSRPISSRLKCDPKSYIASGLLSEHSDLMKLPFLISACFLLNKSAYPSPFSFYSLYFNLPSLLPNGNLKATLIPFKQPTPIPQSALLSTFIFFFFISSLNQ